MCENIGSTGADSVTLGYCKSLGIEDEITEKFVKVLDQLIITDKM